MQGQIDAKELARLITAARSTIENRQTIPVLGCVRLAAKDRVLTLEATNLEQFVHLTTPADLGDGIAIVDPQRLLTTLGSIQGTAKIERREDRLNVSGKGGRASIACMPEESWPTIEIGRSADPMEINAARLNAVFAAVSPSIDTGPVAGWLSGAHLSWQAGYLTVEACNKHVGARIQVCELKRPDWLNDDQAIIIPKSAIRVLTSVFPEGQIQISLDGTRLVCRSETATVATKLIDGRPLKLETLRRATKPFASYDRASLKHAIATAQKFMLATDKDRGVVLTHDSLFAFANKGEMIKLPVESEAQSTERRWLEFSINLLSIAVSADDSETLTLGVNESAYCELTGSDECLCTIMALEGAGWKQRAVEEALAADERMAA